jgi:hypothetical protein
MKRWIVITSVLVVAGSAMARLGETPDACAKRYGDSVRDNTKDGIRTQEFRKSGIRVRVYSVMKKDMIFGHYEAVALTYCRPAETGTSNVPLSPAEIEKLLDVNAQEETWVEADLIKQSTEAETEPEQSRLIRDAGEYTLWSRASGATARYLKKSHELVIRISSEFIVPRSTDPALLEGF